MAGKDNKKLNEAAKPQACKTEHTNSPSLDSDNYTMVALQVLLSSLQGLCKDIANKHIMVLLTMKQHTPVCRQENPLIHRVIPTLCQTSW